MTRLIAELLAGCWRSNPQQVNLDAGRLESISPLLHGARVAAAAWSRIRKTSLARSPCAHDLRQAYRLQTLRNAVREQEIVRAFAVLREAGIEPVLFKGWAVGRLYADSGVRPFGDIDLLVRPEQQAAALRLLERHKELNVDLDHFEVAGLQRESVEQILARSQTATLGDAGVRVMAAEDHLRVLCLHLLKHGGWSPLWLCDVAAALESRTAGFDWDLCLGADPWQREGIECVLTLAHDLLGVETNRGRELPSWLRAAILQAWETPEPAAHQPPPAIRESLGRLPAALRDRWPDPVSATVYTGAQWDETPRLRYQVWYYTLLARRYVSAMRVKAARSA